ncbi:DNA-deoxyinosine glycosylase [Marilutibacter penaei]|nr:DNA-deoxyinosine glycosylase [Lysobacter penaei]
MLQGFPPEARGDARVLVLGSMPGRASLQAGAYYAHPRNLFWPFMGALLGAGPDLPYGRRLAQLADAGVALWDVLSRCERDGSLDSAIRDARANDFRGFFAAHRGIGTVLFNGAKAESSFQRLVLPTLPGPVPDRRRLPSTSPAHAARTAEDKLAQWRDAFSDAGISLR